MNRAASRASSLRAWVATASKIRKSISGLSARELGWRGGSAGWSIREYVHHLARPRATARVEE